MDTKELLKSGLDDLGVGYGDETLEKFFKFKDILLEWNEKMNLTAITDEKEVIIKHFLDCATIMEAVKIKDGMKRIDVGTGAGFPGIPFKILNPNIEIMLLDSLNKRIKFLDEVVTQLDLKKINLKHMRAEDAGRDEAFRGKYDLCMSRAVARLSVLSEYCLPLVKVGGDFIAMKGPDVAQEIADSEIAIEALGGEIVDVKSVLLPHSDINHTLIVIRKIRQTSKKYPRNASLISKIPIE